MNNVVNFLRKWASGEIVVGLFITTMVVYLTMLIYTLPAVESFAQGKTLFDLSPICVHDLEFKADVCFK